MIGQSNIKRAQVIVLGNEKGGSGKSTVSMHLIVGLMREGYRLGAIDLDARQATLTRYLEARENFAKSRTLNLPLPRFFPLYLSDADSRKAAEADEKIRLNMAIEDLSQNCDIIVIDCPGTDSSLSRLGHAEADVLITPINDSFVDFSMLAKVDPDNHEIIAPSVYTEMVWESRKKRLLKDQGKIEWIVMRNRLGSAAGRNRRDVGATLDSLAKRVGFRTINGFGERVIFRELYLRGLTLMDLREAGIDIQIGMSHVAARNEVRALLGSFIKPPKVRKSEKVA